MQKISTSLALAAVLLLLASCGKHSFFEEDGTGEPSSSSGGGIGELSSSSNGGGVVGPLLQTKWGQGNPYNSMFPMVNGQRVLTDCANTAWAQLIAFHKHPKRGKGQSGPAQVRSINVPSVNFEIDYDWDNMLNTYSNANPGTEQQRNAVATLIYHIAVAREGSSNNQHEQMVNVFGYDKNMQRHWRAYYTDIEWEAMIKQQLDSGLPVYYWGNDPNSAHTFIVDGYDNEGRFHINWGWGGRDDGWYFLDNLNPPSHGRSWYNNQLIVINFKPDAGGVGSNEMSLRNFTATKTSVSQNELFTVTTDLISSGFFPGGQAGVALVDNNGRFVEVIGTANYSERSPGTAGTREINCFVPGTVTPGLYQLRIYTRPTGGDWKIVTTSAFRDGVPNAISFTVNAETGTPGGGYGLALMELNIDKTTVSHNEQFTIQTRTRNVSTDTFPGGQLGAALVDEGGNIIAVIGTASFGELNSGSTWTRTISNCSVPNNISAGLYRLMIVVRPTGGEWRIATLSLPDVPNSIDFEVR